MTIDRRSLIAGASAAAALPRRPPPGPRTSCSISTRSMAARSSRCGRISRQSIVAQIEALVKKHFYDGVKFHRVIEGFMAQTGDPTGTGTGKSDLPNIPAEFSKEKFLRGTVGMARGQDENSANCQFFICFAPARYLEEQYTVWGEVVSGMEFIDKIHRGEPPKDPDKIVKLRLAGDES